MDRLPDLLESNARVRVQVAGVTKGTRRTVDFVSSDGSVAFDALDDGVNEKVYLNVIASSGIINVKTYGAKGDGSTDDTTAIQTAFNAALTAGAVVYFPLGTYKITAVLSLPAIEGLKVIGASEYGSRIVQYTSNTAIFKTTPWSQRGYEFTDLWFDYANQQNFASHPNSICIQLQHATVAAPSFYYGKFSRLRFKNCTYGIKSEATPQVMSVWNTEFTSLHGTNVEHSIIDISAASSSQPINTFRNITHLGGAAEGAASATTGTALKLYGEADASGLDIEDWTGPVIETFGSASLRGVHIERHTMSAVAQAVFVLAGGTQIVDGWWYGNSNFTATGVGSWIFQFSSVVYGRVVGGVYNMATVGAGSFFYLALAGLSSGIQFAPPQQVGGVAAAGVLFPDAGTFSAVAFPPMAASPGATIASAATVTLPEDGSNYYLITGTTTITSITASHNARWVTLQFSGALTLTDGSNLGLAGNFITTANDTISLRSDGTNWIETSRSVN